MAGVTGWHIERVAETGSTNADLLATAPGRPDRCVLVADHQTAGRGRLDRRWDAPPGANLLASLLFRQQPGGAAELVRRVGLAALDACRHCLPDPGALTLKWPNDVLLDGAKLAGILAQGDAAAGVTVVGIGINLRWAPEGAARLGDDVDRDELLGALLAAYDALPANAGALHGRYRGELATLGQRVRVELPDGAFTGRAVDVEPDGRLVVLDDRAVRHRLHAGDVTHLRPA